MTALGHDVMGRVVTKDVTGVNLATETTTNIYDDVAALNDHDGFANAGRLTDATRTVGAVAVTQRFDHDSSGRLARQRFIGLGSSAAKTLEYAYWPNGALKNRRLADGSWVGEHGYDTAGRLSRIDNGRAVSASEPAAYIASITYTARGQTDVIRHGNGAVQSFGHDAGRGWLRWTSVVQGATVPLAQILERNDAGQITAIKTPGGASLWTYAYDQHGRLTNAVSAVAAESRTYIYDLADNMVYNSGLCAPTTTAVVGGGTVGANMVYPAPGAARPHGPLTICGAAVTYDGNGNTLAHDSNGAAAGGDRAFVWDGENRPVAITRGGQAATFAYGPDGARVMKTFGTETRWYLGAEADIAGPTGTGLLTSHLHPDVKRSGAIVSWSHADHLASIRLETCAACHRAPWSGRGLDHRRHEFPQEGQAFGWRCPAILRRSTNVFTRPAGISFTAWPSLPISRAQ